MHYLTPLEVPGLQEKLSLPCIITLILHSEESSLRLHKPPPQILPLKLITTREVDVRNMTHDRQKASLSTK